MDLRSASLPRSASARPQGLCVPCPGRRVHRQSESRSALRFGCKVSIAMTYPKDRQFVLHTKSLQVGHRSAHGRRPGAAERHELAASVSTRGYDRAPARVWIGASPRVTASVRRETKHHAAVKLVIDHIKAEHRMDRNYLEGCIHINAVLAAAATTWPAPAAAHRLCVPTSGPSQNCPGSKDRLNQRSSAFFTEDYIYSIRLCSRNWPSEPPRDCRRLFCLSHAATAVSATLA